MKKFADDKKVSKKEKDERLVVEFIFILIYQRYMQSSLFESEYGNHLEYAV